VSERLFILRRVAPVLLTAVTLAACAVPSKSDRVDVSAAGDGASDTGGKAVPNAPGRQSGANVAGTRPKVDGTGTTNPAPDTTTKGSTASPAAPCVSSATETCGPFAPEFIQACRQYSGTNATACLNPKWSKTWYDSLAAHVRGHLSDGSASAAWSATAAKCSLLYLAKDLKVALRSEADPDKAAVFADLAGAQTTVFPLETWGDWRKVRVNTMGAPSGAGGKEGWLLGIGLSCTAPQ